VRSHWREPGYWRWLWHRVPSGARSATLAVFLIALVGAGWVTADRATSSGSNDAVGSDPILIRTTVQKVVTYREKGKVIRKVIPVVKKIKIVQGPETVYQTQRDYVTRIEVTPGKAVTHTVSALVPVTSTRQITVDGKPRIVVRTQLVPTTRTQTVPLTKTVVSTHSETAPGVTNNNTVTKTDTRTLTHSETRTQTQIQTQTQVQTVVQTQTVTRTETQTVTATETVTVQSDPVTVVRTVTEVVTAPGDGGGGGGGGGGG
jgi:hypothetical protein